MGGMPIEWPQQMAMNYFNLQPSSVRGRNNVDTEVHKRYLYNKLFSVYEFTIPETWALNWFRFWLFYYGSIAVIYTREFGWYCGPYGVTSLDLYYQPSSITVANHMFKSEKNGKIGVNAGIIRMMDDFYSLDDLVTKYAVMLAQVDKDINVNLMNANVSLIAEVENSKKATEIKTAYGEATEGKPLTVINKDVMNGSSLTTLFPNAKSTYIGDQLLNARRNILNQFLTDIGIRNFNMDKREQVSRVEVTENNDETKALCSIILDNMKSCMEEINKISDLGLSVKFRYDYQVNGYVSKGGENNGSTNSMGNVPV